MLISCNRNGSQFSTARYYEFFEFHAHANSFDLPRLNFSKLQIENFANFLQPVFPKSLRSSDVVCTQSRGIGEYEKDRGKSRLFLQFLEQINNFRFFFPTGIFRQNYLRFPVEIGRIFSHRENTLIKRARHGKNTAFVT